VKDKPPSLRRKIKILFLIDLMGWGGGTENHLMHVARNLDRKKFTCSVRALEVGDGLVIRQIQRDGVSCESLSVPRVYDFNGMLGAIRLTRYIREEQFDIVQTFHFASDVYGALVAKLGGVPIVISSRRDMDAFGGFAKTAMRKLADLFVTRFIAVCDAVAANITQKEKVSRDRITTIYNGVDLDHFKPRDRGAIRQLRHSLGIQPNTFVIGNVSGLRPEKDHESFFQAIKQIRTSIPDLKAFVIGIGPMLDSLKARCAADPSLKDIVTFTGRIKDVRDYVSILDIACLCPAQNEGFSNALLEEMALGKAIVATDVGGNAEAVVHGKSGIIVPPGNPRELADAFLQLYKEPALRASLGLRARERVEEHFDLRKIMQDIEQFYLEAYSQKFAARGMEGVAHEEKPYRSRLSG
jgi:glycosyltransferase involved in cell wall biosynthesis